MNTVMTIDEQYMQRCFDLAARGAGYVAPNPLVGAVLVNRDRIIGEGYHQEYGKAHAEVNCIASVSKDDEELIKSSTLYVSLEPCAHFGKTPPCADLIIEKQIPEVVVGCRDPFEEVNGKGIEKLKAAGVSVRISSLETEARELNKRFFCFHLQKRPYIVLKWAETSDGFIGRSNNDRLLITNDYSNRLVHQWRGEEAGILIGTNTALKDDPQLNNRLSSGKSPIRIIIDRKLQLPETLRIFDRSNLTMILNDLKSDVSENLIYLKTEGSGDNLSAIVEVLYQQKILSIIVEGGARVLQSFINQNYWDEARVFLNPQLKIREGIYAPELLEGKKVKEEKIGTDRLTFYRH